MELSTRFEVEAGPDEVFVALLDVERVATCLPGVELQGREGDAYRGAVKVKVGPLLAEYAGSARIVQVDEAARTAALTASATEVRGQGGAEARMDLAVSGNGGGSAVEIRTALDISGRAAQFGRGVLETVADRLVRQFAANLEALLTAPVGSQAEQPAEEPPRAAPAPVSPPAEALDVLAFAPPALRRALPLVAAALLGFLLARLAARSSAPAPQPLVVVVPTTAPSHERSHR